MRIAKAGLPLLLVALFVAARLPNLRAPFIALLDTGFQEAIALHHLNGKVLENHFLPVISEVDGIKIYHTAHPPLLHLGNALLYTLFGIHEWVTRLGSLILYLLSIALWLRLLSEGRRSAFLFFALALFLPLPFALALTTNYEPLALFAVSAIVAAFSGWQKSGRPAWLVGLLAAVLLACLSDWPAYLAVPVLFLLNWRRAPERKLLLALILLEAAAFVAILFWQHSVAGEVVFFSHAATRNNPLALLQMKTYLSLGDHLLYLLGSAPLLLCGVWLLALLKQRETWSPGLSFFALFFILLFLFAPQLVAKHEVYLFYLAPALIFLSHDAILRSPRPWLLLAISLILFFPFDLRHAAYRNYRYYFLAQAAQQSPNIRLAFSSPAIGLFRYYAGIETLYPTSAAASKFLEERSFDLIALDLLNPEVAPVKGIVREHQENARLRWTFGDEQYFVRETLPASDFYLAVLRGWNLSGDWREPRPEVVSAEGNPAYAIRQHPAGLKPMTFPFIEGGRFRLTFAGALDHTLPFRLPGDGAGFLILAESDSGKHLLFSRYLPDPAGRGAVLPNYSLFVNLSPLSTLYLITDAGPKNNFAFDDAVWLSARAYPLEGTP